MSHIGVFLDRDGTVSEEVGYVNHLTRFRLLPGTIEAIKRFNQAGLKTILVTNQAGVARGYFKEELIWQVHEDLETQLKAAGAYLDGIYYCPHHPSAGVPPYRTQCECRKPKPGLLRQAAQAHDIDLTRSFMVGDKYTDMELAQVVGAKGVMVMTGYGLGEYEYQRASWPKLPDKLAAHLLEASEWILKIASQANE